jgi:hypothetical protein
MITGKKVLLSGVEEEHLPILLKWRNNPEFRKYYREYRVLTIEDKKNWWKSKICNDDTWQFFVVKPLDKDFVIGSIGLTYIHPIYKTAEFSITIGHERYRGGGYGSDALRTLVKYGFEQLNLNRIWCEVYSNNDAIGIYRHIGFKDEGKLRQTVFKNGEYLDSYVLGMLKSDYDDLKSNEKI